LTVPVVGVDTRRMSARSLRLAPVLARDAGGMTLTFRR
jgi:hypothetical protein